MYAISVTLTSYDTRMARDLYAVLGVGRDASEKEARRVPQLARRYHPDVNPGNAERRRASRRSTPPTTCSLTPRTEQVRPLRGPVGARGQIEEMRRRSGGQGSTSVSAASGTSVTASARGGGGRGVRVALSSCGGPPARPGRRARGAHHAGGGVPRGLAHGGGARRGGELPRLQRRGRAGGRPPATPAAAAAAPPRCVASRCRSRPACATGRASAWPARAARGGHGGAPGDLFLRVELRAHPRFERRGDDLYVDADVPVAEAAAGRRGARALAAGQDAGAAGAGGDAERGGSSGWRGRACRGSAAATATSTRACG